MISSKITKRYAKSLIELSIDRGELTESYNDLVLVNKVCSENNDFILMLKSPIIGTDKKLTIIKSIFSKKISKLTLLFIEIITKKKREYLLSSIAKNFVELYKTHNKIISNTKFLAIELSKYSLFFLVIISINKSVNLEIFLEKIDFIIVNFLSVPIIGLLSIKMKSLFSEHTLLTKTRSL
jgi:F-type H+-transporting ATPase subunit delta